MTSISLPVAASSLTGRAKELGRVLVTAFRRSRARFSKIRSTSATTSGRLELLVEIH